MSYQSAFRATSRGNVMGELSSMPSSSAGERSALGPTLIYPTSPAKSRRSLAFNFSSPVSPAEILIDGFTRMEEAAASRMATRMALARMEARQLQKQQEAVDFMHMQQRQRQQTQRQQYQHQHQMQLPQLPRIVSPVKQRRTVGIYPAPVASKLAAGLDLLSAASLTLSKNDQQAQSATPRVSPGHSRSNSSNNLEEAMNATEVESSRSTGSVEEVGNTVVHMAEKSGVIFVDSIHSNDVLCGRGGKSNHHLGNKKFRQVVANLKYMYQQCPQKNLKTDLARAIVEHCCSYGARFVKLDSATGKYFVLTKAEARKKTSQALRETKALKWTV